MPCGGPPFHVSNATKLIRTAVGRLQTRKLGRPMHSVQLWAKTRQMLLTRQIYHSRTTAETSSWILDPSIDRCIYIDLLSQPHDYSSLLLDCSNVLLSVVHTFSYLPLQPRIKILRILKRTSLKLFIGRWKGRERQRTLVGNPSRERQSSSPGTQRKVHNRLSTKRSTDSELETVASHPKKSRISECTSTC